MDVFGTFVFLFAAVLLHLIPFVDAIVLGPNESPIAEPTSAVGVLAIAVLAAGVGVAAYSDRLLSIAYAPTADGETIWNEVILFGATALATIIASGVVLMAVWRSRPIPALVGLLQIGAVTGISLAAIHFRRRGRIEYPGWIRADSWGFWDYAALFWVSAMLVGLYAGASDPTGALGSAFAVSYGTGAVILRKAGVFVPGDDGGEFNSRGPERSR